MSNIFIFSLLPFYSCCPLFIGFTLEKASLDYEESPPFADSLTLRAVSSIQMALTVDNFFIKLLDLSLIFLEQL